MRPRIIPLLPNCHGGDVSVDDRASPTMVKIHLRQSKCDQFGKGVEVIIGRTDTPTCPIAALTTYIIHHQDIPGAFFLTKEVLVLCVCVCVCSVYPSVPALAASASVETSNKGFSWISMCGDSKKPSVQKLWRGKANMQMSWSSPSAAFAQFRDQRNAAAT